MKILLLIFKKKKCGKLNELTIENTPNLCKKLEQEMFKLHVCANDF